MSASFVSAGLLSARHVLRYHPGMDRIEIYRIANLLIEKHGNDAVLEAAKKADAMLEKGDLDGLQMWKAIGRVIKDTQRGEREESGG